MCQNESKGTNLCLSDLEKSHLVPSLGRFMPNRKNNTCQFLRKWSNKPKMSKFLPLTFKEQPFERFNQILLMICCLCHPKEASCKKRKKVIEQFLRTFTLKCFPFDPMLIFRPPKIPVTVIESHYISF